MCPPQCNSFDVLAPLLKCLFSTSSSLYRERFRSAPPVFRQTRKVCSFFSCDSSYSTKPSSCRCKSNMRRGSTCGLNLKECLLLFFFPKIDPLLSFIFRGKACLLLHMVPLMSAQRMGNVLLYCVIHLSSSCWYCVSVGT